MDILLKKFKKIYKSDMTLYCYATIRRFMTKYGWYMTARYIYKPFDLNISFHVNYLSPTSRRNKISWFPVRNRSKCPFCIINVGLSM